MGMIKIYLLIGIVSAGVSYLGKWMEKSAKYYEETKEFCGILLWTFGIIGAGVCIIVIGLALVGVTPW